jgi:serine/threonine-protein phosphatase 6 regulatory ankyrin repeat subunit B
MQTLLAAGAEIDIPHREGWTALMIASQEGRTDAVRLLLEAGADVHLTTEQGGTYQHHLSCILR